MPYNIRTRGDGGGGGGGGDGGGMLHEGVDDPPVSPMDNNILEHINNGRQSRQSPIRSLRRIMGCIGEINPRNLLRSRESTSGAASDRMQSRGSSRGLTTRLLTRSRGRDAGNDENNDENIPSGHNEVLIDGIDNFDSKKVGTFHSPSREYNDLRRVIAKLLRHKDFIYKAHHLDDMAKLLRVATGNDALDVKLLEVAFGNKGTKTYCINCEHSFGFKGHVIYVSLSKQFGNARNDDRGMTRSVIGCFKSEQVGNEVLNWNVGALLACLVQDEIGLSVDDVTVLDNHANKKKEPKSKKKKESPEVKQDKIISTAFAAIQDAEETIEAEKEKIAAAKEELAILKKLSREDVLSSQLKDEEKAIEEMKTTLASAIEKSKSTKLALSKLQKQDDDDNSSMEEEETDEEEEVQERPQDEDVVIDSNRPPAPPLYIIYGGRVAKMVAPTHGIVTLGDIDEHYVPLPYTDCAKARKNRLSTQYHITTCGSSQAIVPTRFTTVLKGHLSRFKANNAKVMKLMKLFSGKRCKLSPQSMRFLMIFTLHNLRGSDEGVTMTIAAAFYIIIHLEMGIPITGDQLGYMCPSEALFRAWKYRLAGEMFIKHVYFIRKRGVKCLHFASDHGERKNQSAFVKGISYGYSADTNVLRIEFIASDFDQCGHQSDQVVAGLKKMVEKIREECPDVIFISVEGDNGGGGGVEAIFFKLIEEAVLERNGRYIVCCMHALNKCIETGLESVTGKQGLNMDNCLQMGYATIRSFIHIKSRSGLNMLDALKEMAIDKLIKSGECQSEVAKNCYEAFEEAMALFQEEDLEKLMKEMEFERNLQEQIWTRWGTTLRMAKFLKKNWTICYIMLTLIVDTVDSKLALHKTAGTALSLMKCKAKDAEGKESGEPVMYAQICWMDAFARVFFDDTFETVMRANPNFGRESHGYLANMMHLLTFHWKDSLLTLFSDDEAIAGSWENHPDFKSYRNAIKNMPELGAVNKGGKEFFLQLPKTFIKNFMVPFEKHIESCWGSEMLWPYMLFGNKYVARLAMRWLLTVTDVAYSNDVEYAFGNDELIGETFVVTDHVPNQTITIDVQRCMTYLIRNVKEEPHKLLKHPLIDKCIDALTALAHAPDTVVDIFEKEERSSWGDYNFQQLVDVARDEVVPHTTQNQRLERLVQAFNYSTKANTCEARSSAEAMLLGSIKYKIQQKLRAEERAKKETQEEKDSIIRVRGQKLIAGSVRVGHDMLDNELMEALAHTPVETRRRIIKEMGSSDNKASRTELEAQIDEYQRSADGKRKMRAAEMKERNMHLTSEMGGTVVVSKLLKGTKPNYTHVDHVKAELDERGIEPPQSILKMNWKDVRNLLKDNEYTNMTERPQDIEIWQDVTRIVPQSEKMKELLISFD